MNSITQSLSHFITLSLYHFVTPSLTPTMLDRSISKNFIVQLLGRIGAILIGVLSISVMTRSLGAEGFGEYTTVMTFLQLFGVVVDFGLTLTLIVMISEAGADEEKIVGNMFALRLVSGAILFTLAPLTILALPWSLNVQQGVLVGALAYVLMGGASLLVGIFQRHQAMWRTAIAEMINRAVLLALLALFAFLNLGVVWMIAGGIVANGVWLLLMIRFAKPFVSVHLAFDLAIWKQIVSRSWPIAISIFFNLLYLKGDILFLAYFRDQTEVGLYGVSYRIIDVLTALPVMFMGLLLPLAVQHWTTKNKEAFRKQVSRTFDLFMMAIIPIIIGTQAIGPKLIALIAGPGYEISGEIIKLLILAMIGVFLGALFGHLIVAINKQKQMTLGYIAVAIISVAGYLWLIPIYGIWGAVWMTLFSEGLIALITYLVVHKEAELRLNPTITLKALLAAGVMYVVLISIPTLPALIDLLIAVVVYIAIMLAIKAITISELKTLVTTQPKV